MPNWKKVIVSGSSATLTNVTATGNLTVSGVASLEPPAAPTSLTTSIVDDTINVTFTQSTTADISHYEIHASDDGSTYGLIATITPQDMASSMSVIDDTFRNSGTQAYRVFAVKAGTLDVVDMKVVPGLNSFLIKWDPPSTNSRFVTAYVLKVHEHTTQASVAEGSATQIYSGLNTSFNYQVSGIDNDNYHQFWLTTTVA